MESIATEGGRVVGPYLVRGVKVMTLGGYDVAEVLMRQGDYQIWRMALAFGVFKLVRIATRAVGGELGIEELETTRGKFPSFPVGA